MRVYGGASAPLGCPKFFNKSMVPLTKDPSTDLNKVIPYRFYGDGAEAMRSLDVYYYQPYQP